ncbi:MAG: flagellar hook-basal body complex protein [Pirellula sp.]|nr:flagellar hook-basal body complex protein [Pirellula sp.]
MGLASSLSTALTGMNAAETQIDVLGNNLANSQTVGFKSSDVVFASQFLQTLSLGASPTAGNGGTNPRQTGLGVQVAAINPNFKQGTVEISSSPSDLAIQGDGFFQVQGGQGEKLYTRNGIFRLNSANELVTSTGNRLLGFGVDDQFNLQTTETRALTIPIGTESVAKATTEVTMQGNLTSLGDVATTSKIIQSSVLGSNSIPRPPATVNVQNSVSPLTAGISVSHTQGGAGTHTEGSVYQYRFSYVDASGRESMPSEPFSVTVPAGNGTADNSIVLNNLPAANTQYSQLRIYRTAPGGSDFFLAGTAAAGGTFTDTSATSSSTALNGQGITGNYNYMVTFFRLGEPESRPSPLLGPQNVINGRVFLSNLPTPPSPPPGGGFPAYDQIRIYRNLANDPNSFYLVDTVAPGSTYTDSKTDAQISNLATAGNQRVNLDGPPIDSNTRLVDVLTRSGLDYTSPFKPGELTFRARKGEKLQDERTFTITNASTIQDLMGFMKSSMGIVSDSGDAGNPVKLSENLIQGEGGFIQPNAYISNGAIRFVSNTGVDNGVSIDLTSMRLKDANGVITTPNLAFGTLQEAKGQSTVTDFIAYDSLGFPVRLRVTAVMESRNDQQTVYRWYADSSDNSESGSPAISVGTGLIYFDGNGNLISSPNNVLAVERSGLPSTKPLQITINFDDVNGLATNAATLAAARQDGSPPGVLTSYVIGEDGTIRGVFSNGISRDLGQIRLARFSNPGGLEQRGQNLFAQGINTGLPIEGRPAENGLGTISAGALELSNTDVGGDLVTLVLASTQYRSNARVITATQQLFDELLNIRR